MKKTGILLSVATILLLLPLSQAISNQIYLVSLEYDNGTLALKDITQKDGFPTGRNIQPEEGYECRVYSTAGRLLERFMFGMPLTSCYDRFDNGTGEMSGGCFRADSANFTFAIQHFENAKEMDFYDPDGYLILSVGLAELGENLSEAEEEIEEYSEEKGDEYYLLFAVLAVIFVATFLIHKKRKEILKELKR